MWWLASTSRMATSVRLRVYLVPGFDPVGPSRYLSIFKDGCRRLSQGLPEPINVALAPAVQAGSWPGLSLTLPGQAASRIEIRIADYSQFVRQHCDLSPPAILVSCLKKLVPFLVWGFWISLRLDHRIALLILVQLLAVQATLTLPGLLLVPLVGGLLSLGVAVPLVVVAAGFSALLGGRLWWMLLARTKLVWLVRAMLFQDRLARPHDRTLTPISDVLGQQLSALEAADPVEHVVLASHSSGLAPMLLVADRLQADSATAVKQRLTLLSLGRSLPLQLGRNALNQALTRLLADASVPWLDITTRIDLLCDALMLPGQALAEPQRGSRYPRRLQVDYSGTANCPDRLPGLLGLPQLLAQQFTPHFLYLTSTDLPRQGPGRTVASLPLLLLQALKQNRWPPSAGDGEEPLFFAPRHCGRDVQPSAAPSGG